MFLRTLSLSLACVKPGVSTLARGQWTPGVRVSGFGKVVDKGAEGGLLFCDLNHIGVGGGVVGTRSRGRDEVAWW